MPVLSSATDDILIAPHQPFTRVFDVTSKQDAMIHLVRVSLQWGTALVLSKLVPYVMIVGSYLTHRSCRSPTELNTIRFTPAAPLTTIEFVHRPPALIGAPYHVEVVLSTNGETVTDGMITFECSAADGATPAAITDDSGRPLGDCVIGPFEGGKQHIPLQLQAAVSAQCSLKAVAHYTAADTHLCSVEFGVAVPCVVPFTSLFTLFDAQRRPIPCTPPHMLLYHS